MFQTYEKYIDKQKLEKKGGSEGRGVASAVLRVHLRRSCSCLQPCSLRVKAYDSLATSCSRSFGLATADGRQRTYMP
jgi:hypothetical protein